MKNIEDLTECPKCGANWDAGDIYDYYKSSYPDKSDSEILEMAASYGWSTSNKQRFSLLIGIDIPNICDGVSLWQCPECGTQWYRFTNEELTYV